MNLQLTISMLVSDRRDTIERSLESIVPLLRELQSELIVVWTGSDQEVLDIVKHYTDKIIPFSWCNNFSKARNAGLEAALGDWFIYLDDDEWFEDTALIIDFLKSGEERLFNSAVYLQRNYDDWAGEIYTDTWVGRMCRRLPETRFIHPVHETLDPWHGPCKRINAFVHHYGYVGKKDDERNLGKSDRNLPLLLQAIEEEPYKFHHHSQLVKEYIVRAEYDKAEETARRALELMETHPDYDERTSVQAALVECLDRAGKRKEAEQVIEEFLSNETVTRTASMIFYCYLLVWHSEDPSLPADREFELLRSFERVCESLRTEPDGDVELVSGTRNEEFMERHIPLLYLYGVKLASLHDDMDETVYWLSRLPWGSESMTLSTYSALDAWKTGRGQSADFIKCFSMVDGEDAYLYLQKAFCCLGEDDEKAALRYFKKCEEEAEEWLYPQIVALGIQKAWSCSKAVEGLSVEQWNQIAVKLLHEEEISQWNELEERVGIITQDCPDYNEIFSLRRMEEELLEGQNWGDEFVEKFFAYCRASVDFYSSVYSETLLKKVADGERPPRMILLEPDCRFALSFAKVMDDEELGARIGACRTGLKHYPRMAGAVKKFLAYLNEQLKKISAAPGEEFKMLAEQIKKQVAVLVKNGQEDMAVLTLEQLLKLTPGDLEAIRMKQQILESISRRDSVK